MIPLCDLKLQYLSLKDEIDAAMQRVAADANYILGPNVKTLEQEIASYCDCRFAAGVANGTDALHLALRALRLGPGDEVITTPFTFVATTEAIGMVGATPVFVDIDPATFNIDPDMIERAITPRTKAILPVHLYGQPCDMDAILEIAKRHNLFVVEDCAQAIGARFNGRSVGGQGDVGCLSFFPSKNLGCFGDGGMVITNDPEIHDRVEMLRRHGGKIKYHHDELGLNSRLDELQAAILRVKLARLPQWTVRRRDIAYRYNELLADVAGIVRPAEARGELITPVPDTPNHPSFSAAYHQYTLLVENRDAVMAALKNRGVSSFPYYPVPLHLQRVHKGLGYKLGDFPASERAANCCLSLPMFPELTEDQQDIVVHAVRQEMLCNHNKAAA